MARSSDSSLAAHVLVAEAKENMITNPEKAKMNLEKAQELDPSDANIFVLRAQLEYEQGNVAKSYDIIKKGHREEAIPRVILLTARDNILNMHSPLGGDERSSSTLPELQQRPARSIPVPSTDTKLRGSSALHKRRRRRLIGVGKLDYPVRVPVGGDGDASGKKEEEKEEKEDLDGIAALPPDTPLSVKAQGDRGGGGEGCVVVGRRCYRKGRVLGRGGSSQVFEAFSSDGSPVAVKLVDLSRVADDEAVRNGYLQEVQLLEKLSQAKCPYIIELYNWEYQRDKEQLYIVMAKGERDLGTVIKAGQLPWDRIGKYWEDMLRAVQAVHEANVVHGDLKPANFVEKEGHLCLIDFGIADQIDDGSTSVQRQLQKGTANYMAPEAICFDGKMKVGPYSDVWSLGCILYAMLGGRPPFHNQLTLRDKFKAIQNPSYEIEFPSHWDRLVVSVIELCLKRNPKKRVTISELLSQRFLDLFFKSPESRAGKAEECSPSTRFVKMFNPHEQCEIAQKLFRNKERRFHLKELSSNSNCPLKGSQDELLKENQEPPSPLF